MKIKLPPLPYSYDALEPHISAKALKIHYLQHQKKYLDSLNRLIENTAYASFELEEIIVESRKNRDYEVFYNASQVWNHVFYWNSMICGSRHIMTDELMNVIQKSFGSFKIFAERFKIEAQQNIGSGWLWLVANSDGHLELVVLKEDDNPLVKSMTPLLACDLWEHAYYLDYQGKKERYIDHYWQLINWEFVESNLNKNIKNINHDFSLVVEDRLSGFSSYMFLGY